MFWEDFWPNMAATAIGIVLGAPAALWINRQVVKSANEEKEREDYVRVCNALRTISVTMSENLSELVKNKAFYEKRAAQVMPRINATVWDAVKADILNHLHNPELKRDLANHFASLNQILQKNEKVFEFSISANESLVTRSQLPTRLRNNLLVELSELSGKLILETPTLIKSIDVLIAN